MPVPTPHQSGEGTGILCASAPIEEMPPRNASGRSAAHALDAQHERQNRKKLPMRATAESYYFCALAIASISTWA